MDGHLASLVSKQASNVAYEGMHSVRLDKGEFLCPLCKAISNALIVVPGPASSLRTPLPVPPAASSSSSSSATESTSSSEGGSLPEDGGAGAFSEYGARARGSKLALLPSLPSLHAGSFPEKRASSAASSPVSVSSWVQDWLGRICRREIARVGAR